RGPHHFSSTPALWTKRQHSHRLDPDGRLPPLRSRVAGISLYAGACAPVYWQGITEDRYRVLGPGIAKDGTTMMIPLVFVVVGFLALLLIIYLAKGHHSTGGDLDE